MVGERYSKGSAAVSRNNPDLLRRILLDFDSIVTAKTRLESL